MGESIPDPSEERPHVSSSQKGRRGDGTSVGALGIGRKTRQGTAVGVEVWG